MSPSSQHSTAAAVAAAEPVSIGAAADGPSSSTAAAAAELSPSTTTSPPAMDPSSPPQTSADPSEPKLVPYPVLPTPASLDVVQEDAPFDQPPQPTAPPTTAPSPLAQPTTTTPLPQDDLPKVALNVLVISGQRKTFRFDAEMTVGRVKELIWSSWPAEWNSDPTQPPAPSYLRILYRGRMLDDESTLSSESLPVLPAPRSTVVHLSVRTFPLESSQDGKDGKDADDQPTRPGLHTRASSRMRSLVGAAPANAPAANPQITPSQRRRRQSNATNSTDGSHSGGGGCGCVIA